MNNSKRNRTCSNVVKLVAYAFSFRMSNSFPKSDKQYRWTFPAHPHGLSSVGKTEYVGTCESRSPTVAQ